MVGMAMTVSLMSTRLGVSDEDHHYRTATRSGAPPVQDARAQAEAAELPKGDRPQAHSTDVYTGLPALERAL